jgi:hypothetical protein
VSDWLVEGDVLRIGELVVVVQRFGVEDWRADARLRSWGIAPLHATGANVLVPCEANEALWLGLTCDEGSLCSGQAQLQDELTGAAGAAELPDEYQFAQLRLAGTAEPIRRVMDPERKLKFEFRSVRGWTGRVELVLVTQQEWSRRSGREPPPPLDRPPTPPLLG